MRNFLFSIVAIVGLGLMACTGGSETPATDGAAPADSVETVAPADTTVGTATDATVEPVPTGL